MRSYKCFFDFNKEEAWLADMARKGYRLTKGSSGCYTFDQYGYDLGEFTFRVDYRYFQKDSDFADYCSMFEDSGWQHIAGTKHSGSQYFVKSRPDANEDIFSDNLSRAGRYKRISTMWLGLLSCYFSISLSLWMISGFHINQLYLTPGLWEKKGLSFVAAFLFETPFALFRLFPILFFTFMIATFAIYGIKSLSLYKKELRRN